MNLGADPVMALDLNPCADEMPKTDSSCAKNVNCSCTTDMASLES
jgi:hypothetical protein